MVIGKPPQYRISNLASGGRILTESRIFPSYFSFSVSFQVGSQDEGPNEEGTVVLIKELIKAELQYEVLDSESISIRPASWSLWIRRF